jgi:hypothetical protein
MPELLLGSHAPGRAPLEAATGLARRRRVATSPLAACMKSAQPLSAFTTLQEFLPSPSLLLVRERLFMVDDPDSQLPPHSAFHLLDFGEHKLCMAK